MERNSSGARSAPCAFGSSGTSDPHAIISSCSLHITHVCWLGAMVRPSERSLGRAAAFGRSTEGRSTADDAASGRAGASDAAATFLSMRLCRRSVASRARLLARSGAAAFGRTGASGASQRGFRPHCGAAESGFIGRR